ncbi:hypothetical protein EVAR_83117_1 [Eumeta japonica]|uniref:Uncharacterized protein n=1 Tax=Eumeta variegata TaxID=151549 RepID=A0A4C1WLC3_EUMVA|nr:hypothetical protein EVAR_83117_1 [Eumeta japonica]
MVNVSGAKDIPVQISIHAYRVKIYDFCLLFCGTGASVVSRRPVPAPIGRVLAFSECVAVFRACVYKCVLVCAGAATTGHIALHTASSTSRGNQMVPTID